MSKIVGKRTEIENGLEVDINITCCESAKGAITALKQLKGDISDIFDLLRPVTLGYYIISSNIHEFEMNYCPTCGDKYKKENP